MVTKKSTFFRTRGNLYRALIVVAAAALAASLLGLVTAVEPAEAAFPGTNGKIAFVNNGVSTGGGAPEIYVTNSDGSGTPTNLTNNATADTAPAFSPDGKKIAFESFRDGNGEIYVMNSDGSGNPTRVTNNAAPDSHPAFSPDGEKIAFHTILQSKRGNGTYEIYVTNSDGSGTPTNLTNNAANDVSPAFSPDGEKIAFVSDRLQHKSGIYVMNSDGSETPTRLTNPGIPSSEPNFSPDGEKIAFSSTFKSDARPEIYVMNSDGSGRPTNLTNNAVVDSHPAFSPDGEKIVFVSFQADDTSDIYVTNSDGSGTANNLTNSRSVYDLHPDWGPAVDNILPTITINTPVSDATYRRDDTVNAEYNCTDEPGGSGLNTCVGSVPNGSPIDTTCTVGTCTKSFTVEAVDNAGNKASKTLSYTVNSDNILPTITITSPIVGATMLAGDTTINAEYSCADEPGGSGLNTCVGSVPNGSPIDTTCFVGTCTKGLTVNATDKAGNNATMTRFYFVLATGPGTG